MAKTGSFDLNFPGAKIICDSPLKRESLLKYFNREMSSYEVELSLSDLEDDVQNAIYNTTYVHECKHYFDHLLCPYLLHNYTLKIIAFFNSILAINEWNNGKKTYQWIPIPFTTWLKMSYEKKLDLLKKKGLSKKDVPFFSFKDAFLISLGKKECRNRFIHYLLSGAVCYAEYWDNSMQISPEGEKTDFSLKSFTESMAYIQHLTEIFMRYGKYGEKIAQRILSLSFDFENCSSVYSMKHSEYTAAFSMVNQLAKDADINPSFYYPFQSYVLFWSLCGVLENNSLTCLYPRNRLEGLYHVNASLESLELNNTNVIKHLIVHPFETFEKWDNLVTPLYVKSNKEFQGKLYFSNIKFSQKRKSFKDFYDGYIRKYITMKNKLDSLGLFWPSFYVYNIADSLLYMSNLFCEEPGRYLYPEEFSKNLKNFSNVPYRFIFQNVDPIREEECPQKRKGIVFLNDSVYGDSLVSDNIGIFNKKMDYRAYEETKEYLHFSDALYGSSNINMPGTIIKNHLPGIKPWFFKT